MIIKVVKGIGEGKTDLSAFDAALFDAGVHNYNLLMLSSIIPPKSKVSEVSKYETPLAEYGHRLYVVKAEMRSHEAKKYIAAGLGWYQYGEDGRGLFVEHELVGDTKVAVNSEINFRIENSIQDLCKFRNIPFEAKKLKKAITLTQVKNAPACVLALAVFQAEPWS